MTVIDQKNTYDVEDIIVRWEDTGHVVLQFKSGQRLKLTTELGRVLSKSLLTLILLAENAKDAAEGGTRDHIETKKKERTKFKDEMKEENDKLTPTPSGPRTSKANTKTVTDKV